MRNKVVIRFLPTRFLIRPPEKKAHILIPVGFTESEWGKIGGCFYLNFLALGTRQVREFPLVFCKSGLISGIFFAEVEKGHFTGFSDSIRNLGMGNGVQFRLISPYVRLAPHDYVKVTRNNRSIL